MKLLDRFRQLSLVGSGLFWSAYASADLPKLSGGSSSNDVMGDVKKMSQDGGCLRSPGDMRHRFYCGGDFLCGDLSQNRRWQSQLV
ncbi:Uncharacterised protein [Salmonella enterica subsp. enterica]|nr:Uncharacterised protein [Salmonella enterica subsp. enterica]